MIRPQNSYCVCQLFKAIVVGNSNVLQHGNHYQKFNSITSRRPWPPILISHLFHHDLFQILVCNFFTPVVFWLRFHFFLYFFCFVATCYGVLANVAVDYFRLLSRHGNTVLIHVETITHISLKRIWKYTKFYRQIAICKGYL